MLLNETIPQKNSVYQCFFSLIVHPPKPPPPPLCQAFYRYRRKCRQTPGSPSKLAASSDDCNAVDGETKDKGGAPAEGRMASMRRRMEYAVGMIGRHATLARLRKSRRLPLTEAAYNGHYAVLQVLLLSL